MGKKEKEFFFFFSHQETSSARSIHLFVLFRETKEKKKMTKTSLPCLLQLVVSTLIIFGVVASSSSSSFANAQVAAPVIGIFTTDASWCGGNAPPVNASAAKHCIDGYYVRWFEMAGIRVIPFPWNASEAEQRYLAERINGIFFPGGGLDGAVLDYYITKVDKILQWAVEWNSRGDKFVLWGTCQGFQVLAAAAARNPSVIQGYYHGMYPSMMPLNWTANTRTSRMFGTATTPPEILNWLSHKPTTLNWHHYIVTPESFVKNPGLARIFTPIAVDTVPNTNTIFVAAMEATNGMNLFATQFHPERPPYEFSNDIISHSYQSIAISQYLAAFAAARLRENNHTFENLNDLESRVVENWLYQYLGWGSSIYWGN